MPTIFDHSDVYIDDIAFFECLVIGDAVADLVIDGCADGFGVGVVTAGVVVQRSGDSLLNLGDVIVGQFVEFVGGNTGYDMGAKVIQNF